MVQTILYFYIKMPQVSRRPLKKETQDRITRLFLQSLALCASVEQAADFIDDLLTPTEKTMLIKRLAVAYLLLDGYSYDTIVSLVKVSRPTVGMIALKLKIRGNGLRNALGSVKKRKEFNTFFQELGDAIIDIIGKGKGNDWRATNRLLHQRKRERQEPF